MHSCTALLLLAVAALTVAAPTGHEPVAEHREMVDDMDHGNKHDMEENHHDGMHDMEGKHHGPGGEAHGQDAAHGDDMHDTEGNRNLHDLDGNDGEHKMHDMVAGGTQHNERVVSVDHDDLEEHGMGDLSHDLGDHEGDHGETDEGHLKALFDCVDGISQTLCAPDNRRRRREDHDHSPEESDSHGEHEMRSEHHDHHHDQHLASHDESKGEEHDHHGVAKGHHGDSEHERALTAGLVTAAEHLPNPMGLAGLFRLQRR